MNKGILHVRYKQHIIFIKLLHKSQIYSILFLYLSNNKSIFPYTDPLASSSKLFDYLFFVNSQLHILTFNTELLCELLLLLQVIVTYRRLSFQQSGLKIILYNISLYYTFQNIPSKLVEELTDLLEYQAFS